MTSNNLPLTRLYEKIISYYSQIRDKSSLINWVPLLNSIKRMISITLLLCLDNNGASISFISGTLKTEINVEIYCTTTTKPS